MSEIKISINDGVLQDGVLFLIFYIFFFDEPTSSNIPAVDYADNNVIISINELTLGVFIFSNLL